MNCPIKKIDCIESECAWWDDKRNQCAVLVIAQALKGQIKVALAK